MRKIQIVTAGLESVELDDQVDANIQEGETLEEVTEALEAFALLLQPAVEGYALNPAALTVVSSVTNRLVQKAGLPTLSVGTESVAVDTVQQAASLGLEDIKEHLKNAGNAIVEFIRKLFEAIRNKAIQFKEWLSSGFDRVSAKLSGLPKDAFDKKIKTDVRLFKMGGKLSTDLLGDLMLTASAVDSMPTRHIEKIADMAAKASKKSNDVDFDAILREVHSCIESHYKEADAKLKFAIGTGVATRAISGRYSLRVTYDKTTSIPSTALSVDTVESESDVKTITLRSLGLTEDGVKRWESARSSLQAALDSHLKFEDSTWKEFDSLIKQTEWQDNPRLLRLLKSCALVSVHLLKISTILTACIAQSANGMVQLATLATETSQ